MSAVAVGVKIFFNNSTVRSLAMNLFYSCDRGEGAVVSHRGQPASHIPRFSTIRDWLVTAPQLHSANLQI